MLRGLGQGHSLTQGYNWCFDPNQTSIALELFLMTKNNAQNTNPSGSNRVVYSDQNADYKNKKRPHSSDSEEKNNKQIKKDEALKKQILFRYRPISNSEI